MEAKEVNEGLDGHKCPLNSKPCMKEECELWTCYTKQGSKFFHDCGLKKLVDISAPDPH